MCNSNRSISSLNYTSKVHCFISPWLFLCVSSGPYRRAHYEDGSRLVTSFPPVLRLWHLRLHSHREELQAHLGQTPAGGLDQPGRQQHPGGIRPSGDVFTPVQPLDPQRRTIQRPSDHPQSAWDGPHKPVLPGLLAKWRPTDGGHQGQRPQRAEGAEETAESQASRGRGGDMRAFQERLLKEENLEKKKNFHQMKPNFASNKRNSLLTHKDDIIHSIYCRLYIVPFCGFLCT